MGGRRKPKEDLYNKREFGVSPMETPGVLRHWYSLRYCGTPNHQGLLLGLARYHMHVTQSCAPLVREIGHAS